MTEWFSVFEPFEKVYWSIALIASGIFIVLLILTFIGGEFDDTGDVDSDIDGDTGIDFQFLSFKNLIGFFTIFGWTGIACLYEGLSKGITIVVSIVAGLLMMTIMAALFYYLGKLNSSGSLKIKNALNQVGEVYLTIGANRSRIGKVHINIQGGLRELEALTDETYDLHQGDIITVTEITGTGILIVTKHTAQS
jgi:membrane protein implicated in regulation of membrane protease activity